MVRVMTLNVERSGHLDRFVPFVRQFAPDVLCLQELVESDVPAIMAGAAGYVLKRIDAEALIDSIRRVGAGETLLDPAMAEPLFDRLRGHTVDDPLIRRLSPQERRILDLIADGKTNRQIAEEMFLAEKTVKNYISRLLAKLGLRNRNEAAAYMARRIADRQGLTLRGDTVFPGNYAVFETDSVFVCLASASEFEDDAEIGVAVAHRPADAGTDLRIVDRLGRVGALVVDVVTETGEERDEVLLELEAGVVGADGDAGHGRPV